MSRSEEYYRYAEEMIEFDEYVAREKAIVDHYTREPENRALYKKMLIDGFMTEPKHPDEDEYEYKFRIHHQLEFGDLLSTLDQIDFESESQNDSEVMSADSDPKFADDDTLFDAEQSDDE